jgi:opacity protein-like surface antigen
MARDNYFMTKTMINRHTKWVFMLLISVGIGTTSANAQRWFRTSSLEFGVIGGFSHYSGDLTQSYFETKGFKPSVGIITRYTPRQLVTFRLSAQYGKLEGDDKWYEDQNNPERRDLSFQTDIWDFTGAFEFNFNYIDTRQKSGVIPYAFIGASVFKYNPKAVFNYDPNSQLAAYLGPSYTSLSARDGELIELQPLGTEGQETTEFNDRKRYALTQMAIPIGAGFKFKLSHNWSLGVEYGARITFTDYLDDVSGTYVDPTRLQAQYGPMSAAMSLRTPTYDPNRLEGSTRGNESTRDLYGIFGVTLTYRIYGNNPSCPTF